MARPTIDVRLISTKQELEIAYRIRDEVFVKEQGVPESEERDADDEGADHMIARIEQREVGTGRLVHKPKGAGKIGRMAVLLDARGFGVGRAIVEALIERARTAGAIEVYLDSEDHAVPFYRRLGFVEEGDPFLDVGIVHRRMRRRLG